MNYQCEEVKNNAATNNTSAFVVLEIKISPRNEIELYLVLDILTIEVFALFLRLEVKWLSRWKSGMERSITKDVA